jgi:hypothetical protein
LLRQSFLIKQSPLNFQRALFIGETSIYYLPKRSATLLQFTTFQNAAK